MASTPKVKGITIEIYGDDKEFQDTIDGTKKALRELGGESRQLNQHLKFDPKNVEKLNRRLNSLQQQVSLNESLIKKYNDELSKLSDADVGGQQWTKLKKNILDAEKDIAQCNKYINDTKKTLKDVDNVSLDTAKKSLEDLGVQAKDVGDTLTSKVTTPILTAGTAMLATTEATKEYREDMAKLTTNSDMAGASLDKTKESLKLLNAVTGEADSNVEGLSNLLKAGFTDANLNKVVEELSGAVIQFPDTLKIESLADSLQETMATGKATGQFAELLDRLGVGADNFSDKLSKCTTDAQKQDLVMRTLEENGLSKTTNAWKKNNKALIDNSNAQFDLKEEMADFGATVEPIVAKITHYAAAIINWFNKLDPRVKGLIAIIALVIAAIGPAILIVNKLTTSVNFLSEATGIAHSKIMMIIGIIVAVIAVFVLLYNNSEEFRKLVDEIAATVLPFLGQSLNYIWNIISTYLIPAFNKIIEVAGIVLTPILRALWEIFKWIADAIVRMTSKFGEAYEAFKDTTAFKTVKGVFESICKVIDGLVDSFKWISKNVGKIFDGIKNGYNSVKKGLSNFGSWLNPFDSGGYGALAAATNNTTINLSTNFNVTNNGTPISRRTLRQWGNEITDIVDENLGRRGR